MANAIYPIFKQYILDLLVTSTVRVALVDTTLYTYNASHDMLDDIPGPAIVATSGPLTVKTVTGGTFHFNEPVSFTGVSGSQVGAIVFYIDSGAPSTSRLVSYLDTGFTGVPFVPNGGNVTFDFNDTGVFNT